MIRTIHVHIMHHFLNPTHDLIIIRTIHGEIMHHDVQFPHHLGLTPSFMCVTVISVNSFGV